MMLRNKMVLKFSEVRKVNEIIRRSSHSEKQYQEANGHVEVINY
jgi:hypothetical protein